MTTKYYVFERGIREMQKENAGGKARADIDCILESEGFQKIEVLQSVNADYNQPSTISKIARRIRAKGDWKRALRNIKDGELVFVQMPLRNHSLGVSKYLSRLSSSGRINLCCLVHDLELLRFASQVDSKSIKQKEIASEELTLLKGCNKIILHNSFMVDAVCEIVGEELRRKALTLDIFDYLVDNTIPSKKSQKSITKQIVIAGNLIKKKAGYAYALPSGLCFNLYGPGFEGVSSQGVHYKGSYPADELPSVLEGDFGLIWDGPDTCSCTGVYGEYLRVNNPHKASLYLACGLPIIVWNGAAISKYVVDNGVGIAVPSLDSLPRFLEKISDTEYSNMHSAAVSAGDKVKRGYYFRRVLREISASEVLGTQSSK